MQDTLFIGIGGGGSNFINRMISSYQISRENTCCINTDQESLANSKANLKVFIDKKSMELSFSKIKQVLDNFNIIVVIAGLGGETGSTYLPLLVKDLIARGVKVIAVVIKPFKFEGAARINLAENVIAELHKLVLIKKVLVYENETILKTESQDESLIDAFGLQDKKIFSDLCRMKVNQI